MDSFFKNKINVLRKFKTRSNLFRKPFPYIVIPNALPLETYEKLYENYPHQRINSSCKLVEGHTYRYFADDLLNKPKFETTSFWKEFFEFHTSQDFYNHVLNIFEQWLGTNNWIQKEKIRVRGTEGTTKMVTDTQFVVHKPTNITTRTTHIDNPLEIYAGLLYFRQRGDISTGGDFVIYETKEVNEVYANTGREVPKDVEKKESKVIKYKDNAFVMFLNSNKAVHGVTPRVNAMHDRLSINIIAEVDKKVNPLFKLSNIAQ